MDRTIRRPTASGQVRHYEVLCVGLLLSTLGVSWAALMDPLYSLLVFSGLFFDVVIYSIWLKRRTAWSILWGGISGAMPILAGRTLGSGAIDWFGLTLALGILFWIPTHTLTFTLKYAEEYARAGIPTFPSTYGPRFTRAAIAVSTVLAAAAMGSAGIGIGIAWGFLRLLGVLSAGLLFLTGATLIRPSDRINSAIFKYASIYMLASMLMLVLI